MGDDTELGRMRGQVLGVDTRTGDGIVNGDDGRRYRFKPDDWAHRGEPAIGMIVDFETADNRALSLFPVPGTAPPPATAPSAPADGGPDRVVAALLALFVGWLGIHRFYLGRTRSGIVRLLIGCTVFGLIVTLPWALVDTIRYLFMSDREFAQRYPRGR
jgi:TM2 domain